MSEEKQSTCKLQLRCQLFFFLSTSVRNVVNVASQRVLSWANYGRLKTLEAENTVSVHFTFQVDQESLERGQSKSLELSELWKVKSVEAENTVWAHFTFKVDPERRERGQSKSLELSELRKVEKPWSGKYCLSVIFWRGKKKGQPTMLLQRGWPTTQLQRRRPTAQLQREADWTDWARFKVMRKVLNVETERTMEGPSLGMFTDHYCLQVLS